MTATWPVQALIDLGHNHKAISGVLHMSGSAWHRARDLGLTDAQADRAAIRLGHHPAVVWDGWVEAGLAELDRVYLAGGWRQIWLWLEAA